MEKSRHLPPEAATRHPKRMLSDHPVSRFPYEFCFVVLGRDVIAITSVGGRTLFGSTCLPGAA
jgi:hypothetical protein